MSLTAEQIDDLGPDWAAAGAARRLWLLDCWKSPRQGKQIPPKDGDWDILLFLSGRGFGKLLNLMTPIPTPGGWTMMGNLAPGDRVFDEAGKPCTVTWVSDITTPEVAYRVRFSDGSSLDACSEHQWVTWTRAERKAFLRSPYEDTTAFPKNWPTWRLKKKFGVPRTETKEQIEKAFELLAAGANVNAAARALGLSWQNIGRHLSAGRYIEDPPPRVWEDSPGPQIRTTEQIAQTLTFGKRSDFNHCIPQTGPLDLPDVDLPIPPYVLGAWLGDGSSTGGHMFAHEDDMPFMRAQFEADGFPTTSRTDTQCFGTLGLYRLLRENDLLKNKHIPAVYLRASITQRLALLAGLMDTDGGNDNANLVSFTNCEERLVDAVEELIVSFGLKVRRDSRIPICTNNGVAGQRSYRLAFTPHFQPFRMPRKQNRLSFDTGQALRRRHRMIVGVDRIESMPMRCITVDSPNSMYLAGRAMIPTHNTSAIVQWAWWEDWRVPGIITHAIAPTLSDVRGTLFEGPAGFLATIPMECLYDQSVDKAYNKSLHELRLSNGSLIRGFGAQEEAGRLRGPQCHNMIADELREWEKPAGNLELAMTNALFGLRLPYPDGTPSRAVMATTPKPIPFLKRFEKRAGVKVVRGSSYENIKNLAGVYRTTLLSLAGTQIGRQEIDGLYIDEESDHAILKRSWIRLWPKDPDTGKPRKLPEFSFILEVYDTAASEENWDKKKQVTDPSGSIVLGVFNVAQCFTEAERKKYRVRSKYACLLLDCWTERLGLPDLLERARAQHRTLWGPKGRGRRADMVLIENASSGPGLRQFMAKWGIPTWPYNPRIGKTMRAHGISPLVQQGMLWVPESGRPDRENLPIDWSEPFLEQICAFGGEGTTEHDEYVDCISAGFAYLRDRAVLEATPEVQFLDLDEKLDQDKAEAMEMADRERAREVVNPYGV